MQTCAPARQYARITLEPISAAAFVAAVSRFLDSPQGEPFTADASLDVRTAVAADGQIEVYLDAVALRAAEAAFAPLPEFDMMIATDLPAGTTPLLDGRGPALGLDDVNALMPTTEARMRSRLQTGLTAALRAKDRGVVSVLRTALAAIDNAGAVPLPQVVESGIGRSADVARRDLGEQQVVAEVQSEYRERVEAAALFECLGRPDDAASLRAEAQVLAAYLPDESDSRQGVDHT